MGRILNGNFFAAAAVGSCEPFYARNKTMNFKTGLLTGAAVLVGFSAAFAETIMTKEVTPGPGGTRPRQQRRAITMRTMTPTTTASWIPMNSAPLFTAAGI